MNIKAIKTEEDYNQALHRLDEIFHAPINSIEGDEAEVLSILIEKFENENYPIEAIWIRMEEMQIKQVDLIPEIGGKSRVSEVLTRKKN